MFDVQGHFLEYSSGLVNPATRQARDFWTGFPQRQCGEADARQCFSISHFMDEVFLKSDTSMIVLSGLPIAPEGSPQSTQLMDETRRIAEALCQDSRVLLQAQALPNVGDLSVSLDAMSAAASRYPIVAWKVFTNYPDLYDGSGNAWRLDDGDPALAQVGNAFIERAKSLGVRVITAHKGLSTTLGYTSPHSSPVDFGPAARNHPDVAFVAYHSGWESGLAEGPYDDAHAGIGVNRLIAGMLGSGIGPNQNVYAELGTTWWSLMKDPDQAAHVLGKLLKYVGTENVLWGTDSIFYGSPQDQIQAFRAFQISEEFQARYGYPALTDEIKHKILGLNALRLHDVDPITARCEFTRDELESVRQTIPTAFETFGPRRTTSELRAFVAHERAVLRGLTTGPDQRGMTVPARHTLPTAWSPVEYSVLRTRTPRSRTMPMRPNPDLTSDRSERCRCLTFEGSRLRCGVRRTARTTSGRLPPRPSSWPRCSTPSSRVRRNPAEPLPGGGSSTCG